MSGMVGRLIKNTILLESLSRFVQTLYIVLIFVSLRVVAQAKEDPAQKCADLLGSAKYFAMAPREYGEIARLHKVFTSGEVLEIKVFAGQTEAEAVPGHIRDLALILEGSHPAVAEAIRSHGVRVSVEFIP